MCFEKCFFEKKKKFYIRFFHSSHNYNYNCNYTIIPLDPGILHISQTKLEMSEIGSVCNLYKIIQQSYIIS
jgi:hypothetical protein